MRFQKGSRILRRTVWSSILFLLPFLLAACSQEPVSKLKIGDTAPAFSLQDLDGNRISLAELKGSPVLLRFFLTDCNYCRADTPVFNDFYTRYHQQGLQVLYIDSLGVELQIVKTFAKELGILFPVAQDLGGTVSASYNVRMLPQTIVLDPDHTIIAAILGGVSEAELANLLSPYLQQKP